MHIWALYVLSMPVRLAMCTHIFTYVLPCALFCEDGFFIRYNFMFEWDLSDLGMPQLCFYGVVALPEVA